jgi:multiple sugar transport system permease protein
MGRSIEHAGASAHEPRATRLARALVGARGRLRRAHWLQAYLYLLPAFAVIAIWTYWPILTTLQLSFYEWTLLETTPKIWLGLENYRQILTLPELGIALRNTLLYMLGMLPFSVLLPLGIALLIQGIVGRARSVYRAMIFAPMLMAPVVVATIWGWIMNPVGGLLNRALAPFLGTAAIYWFRDGTLAMVAIMLITGWKLLGFSTLIFSAALTNINGEYLDAANVDGATGWQQLRHITLPLMSPTVIFMLMLNVLFSSQWTFPLINVLTQGGPRDATTNIYYLLWQFGFRNFNIGLSTAASVIFFAAFGALALAFVWLSDRLSFYDS